MSKRSSTGKAVIAGAIGSAAVAAAVLYMNRRRDKKRAAEAQPPTPTGEPPETD
jgi:hypothetical protein